MRLETHSTPPQSTPAPAAAPSAAGQLTGPLAPARVRGRRLGLGALVLLLTACASAPVYQRPAAPVAPDWPGAQAPSSAPLGADLAWTGFALDARLRSLIGLALQNNRDLRAAAFTVAQVQAQHQIRSAERLPNLGLAASASRQPSTDGGSNRSIGLGVALSSWEIDFFGRLASLENAALAQYLASQAARDALQTSLVAAVASGWLSLQASGEALGLTQTTLESRRESLRLVRLREANGAASALELRQAESLLAAAEAALAQQQRLRAEQSNGLALLLGQPVPLDLLQAPLAEDAPLFPELGAGLPAEVLVRRPDIRLAEQQLVAANAHIGAARAAFFPRISLTAAFGSASSELSGLLRSGSWGLSLAPQALLPIFDGGRNQAGLEAAEAAREVALAQYERAIQGAFREVADALAGRDTWVRQRAALQAQAQAEAERLRLAELRHRAGVANSLELLDAQRAAYAVRLDLTQTRLAQQLNQVALYKALGGGWKNNAPPARN